MAGFDAASVHRAAAHAGTLSGDRFFCQSLWLFFEICRGVWFGSEKTLSSTIKLKSKRAVWDMEFGSFCLSVSPTDPLLMI